MIIQWKGQKRFKRLDLIDRVPEKLWMEVFDIVQETGIKTIPEKKKCKKAKWPSEKALQIAVKRREVKSKGEKERYTHLNAEFQRIARRDKKGFLSGAVVKNLPANAEDAGLIPGLGRSPEEGNGNPL